MNRTHHLTKRLLKVVSDKKMWLTVLGDLDGYPVWFLRNTPGLRRGLPRLLIIAGFHGEEKAGPLGLIKWLEDFDPHLYENVNLSFIPIVNPVGYSHGERYADKGKRNNCGFCHPENGDLPSREGVILIKHLQALKVSAKHGFLSLHEDIKFIQEKTDPDKFFVYSFERSEQPGSFTYTIRDTGLLFFPQALDNYVVTTDTTTTGDVIAHDGIVYRLCDGSLEDWLFHEGIDRAIVTETPGFFTLKKRVEATTALITKFISTCIELYHG